MKINVPLIEATAAKVKLIKRDKPETTIVKDGVNKGASASKFNKEQLRDLKARLKIAEKEVSGLKKEIADLEASKPSKPAATQVRPAPTGKYTFLITSSSNTGAKPTKSRTAKTLKSACKAKGSLLPSGYSRLYAVTEKGTKTLIMVFTATDPITGTRYKGANWRWTSAAAKARFAHQLN